MCSTRWHHRNDKQAGRRRAGDVICDCASVACTDAVLCITEASIVCEFPDAVDRMNASIAAQLEIGLQRASFYIDELGPIDLVRWDARPRGEHHPTDLNFPNALVLRDLDSGGQRFDLHPNVVSARADRPDHGIVSREPVRGKSD